MKNDKQIKVYPLDKGTGYSLLDDIDDVSKTEEQFGKSKIIDYDPAKPLKRKLSKTSPKS